MALGLSTFQKLKFTFDGNSFLKFWVDDKLWLESQTFMICWRKLLMTSVHRVILEWQTMNGWEVLNITFIFINHVSSEDVGGGSEGKVGISTLSLQ